MGCLSDPKSSEAGSDSYSPYYWMIEIFKGDDFGKAGYPISKLSRSFSYSLGSI